MKIIERKPVNLFQRLWRELFRGKPEARRAPRWARRRHMRAAREALARKRMLQVRAARRALVAKGVAARVAALVRAGKAHLLKPQTDERRASG